MNKTDIREAVKALQIIQGHAKPTIRKELQCTIDFLQGAL